MRHDRGRGRALYPDPYAYTEPEPEHVPSADEIMLQNLRAAFPDETIPGWREGYNHVRYFMAMGFTVDIEKAIELMGRQLLFVRAQIEFHAQQIDKHPSHDPLVYYMLHGTLVKIGTSTNLARRVQSIRPERVLATEPGSYDVESARHKHFADLRSHGEWFRHEGQLAAWINLLTATGGSPCAT